MIFNWSIFGLWKSSLVTFTKENIELQEKILIFALSRKEAIIALEILIFPTIER